MVNDWLVVTGTMDFYIILWLSIELGMEWSSQLTNSIIFQRAWNHQPVLIYESGKGLLTTIFYKNNDHQYPLKPINNDYLMIINIRFNHQ